MADPYSSGQDGPSAESFTPEATAPAPPLTSYGAPPVYPTSSTVPAPYAAPSPTAPPTAAASPYTAPGPTGQDPYGSNASGSNPYGSNPYGSNPYAQQGGYGQPSGQGQQTAAYGHPGYPAGAYTTQGYAPQGYQPAYGQAPTNGMAIAALVVSLSALLIGISAPVGAILGHVALGQIKRTGQQGRGMALAGVIVGWAITAIGVAYVLFLVVVIGAAISSQP